MKNIFKNIVLLLIISLGLTSCIDEWLDMSPDDQIVLDDYWKSAADVEAAVNSMYRYMIADDYVYRLFYWGELRSDNISLDNAKPYESDLWNCNVQTDNDITKWNSFYQVINYCNTVIYYAPGVIKLDANFKEYELRSYLSEALTIRALSYFYLVRTFGDVPFVRTPSKDDSQDFNVPQSTEAVVLDSITKDLILAETYSRETWTTTPQTKGRITKNAIRALLADIYLWRQDYDKCIEQCDDVINDKLNEIVLMESDYLFTKVFYQGNSPESIFELNFSSNAVKNNVTATLYGNFNKGISKGRVKCSSSIQNAYNQTYDLRYKAFMYNVEKDYTKIFKYEGQAFSLVAGWPYTYRGASSTANWILYRLPDIYLMKAEALAQSENTDNLHEAVTLVNRTYTRANPGIDSLNYQNFSTSTAVKKLVLEERRREFAFEGKRWFDLLRMARREGTTDNAAQYVIPGYIDPTLVTQKLSQLGAWYLPIHQTQMAINDKLYQNAYYTAIFGGN